MTLAELIEIRHHYTRERIRQLIREFPRGGRVRPSGRDDRLVTKPAPLEEGPGLAAARERADLESALRGVPLEWVTIAVWAVGECAENCRRHRSKRGYMLKAEWRECLGDAWNMTAGDIAEIVQRVEDHCFEAMNREIHGYDRL